MVKKSEDQAQEAIKHQQMIVQVQEELQKVHSINKNLENETQSAKQECAKAMGEKVEAGQAIIKLDEARLLLNKLLGPQGPMSMAERHKFLT